MKRKLAFALMAVLICSMPISLTGQSQYPVPIKHNIPIGIRLIVDNGSPPVDQLTNNLVKGYFLQSLRQIPDVVIVEDNEMYTIRVLPSRIIPDSYTIMYVITLPFKIGLISPFIYPESRERVEGFLKVGTGVCNVETYGFFNASGQTLEKQCKSFIVRLDAGQLQPLRELRQKYIRDVQNGNP